MQITITEEIKNAAIHNMVNHLPALRALCHYSQNDLAVLIGLSRQTIAMIENKKRTMSWNVFLSLLFVFSQTQETANLLVSLNIYTCELQEIYKNI